MAEVDVLLGAGADLIGAAAALTNDELRQRLDDAFRTLAAVEADIVVLLGEVDRREAYRAEGATSSEPWVVERFGVSLPTARAYVQVAERVGSPPPGDVLARRGDRLRQALGVAGVATPETRGASPRPLIRPVGLCTLVQAQDPVLARQVASLAPWVRLRSVFRSSAYDQGSIRRSDSDGCTTSGLTVRPTKADPPVVR
jgi:hypothetical protein